MLLGVGGEEADPDESEAVHVPLLLPGPISVRGLKTPAGITPYSRAQMNTTQRSRKRSLEHDAP